jgi:hypothetical protein
LRANGEKQALEDSEIKTFVFEGECEMSFESCRGSVTGSQDTPTVFEIDAVMLAGCGEGSRKRLSERKLR